MRGGLSSLLYAQAYPGTASSRNRHQTNTSSADRPINKGCHWSARWRIVASRQTRHAIPKQHQSMIVIYQL